MVALEYGLPQKEIASHLGHFLSQQQQSACFGEINNDASSSSSASSAASSGRRRSAKLAEPKRLCGFFGARLNPETMLHSIVSKKGEPMIRQLAVMFRKLSADVDLTVVDAWLNDWSALPVKTRSFVKANGPLVEIESATPASIFSAPSTHEPIVLPDTPSFPMLYVARVMSDTIKHMARTVFGPEWTMMLPRHLMNSTIAAVTGGESITDALETLVGKRATDFLAVSQENTEEGSVQRAAVFGWTDGLADLASLWNTQCNAEVDEIDACGAPEDCVESIAEAWTLVLPELKKEHARRMSTLTLAGLNMGGMQHVRFESDATNANANANANAAPVHSEIPTNNMDDQALFGDDDDVLLPETPMNSTIVDTPDLELATVAVEEFEATTDVEAEVEVEIAPQPSEKKRKASTQKTRAPATGQKQPRTKRSSRH